MKLNCRIVSFLAVLCPLGCFAFQTPVDTLVLDIHQVEQRFIDSNYSLLAAHYNVDASKALIEQAKKWDNPVLNTDQGVAANGKLLTFGKDASGTYNGQYFIQVQQLIRTAGKRNRLVDMAVTNTRVAELQLDDLVRTLRYQLRTSYYTLVQLLQARTLYQQQLSQLNKLLTAMAAQLQAGNIALKDYLRLQALVVSLNQDINTADQSLIDTETTLKTILRINDDVFIKPSDSFSQATLVGPLDFNALLEQAKLNNPSYILQRQQEMYQQQNLQYQKALKTPDITVGPEFDKNSNFAPNYFGVSLSIPLPLLNKNQGNIRNAEFAVKQQHALTLGAASQLNNNLLNSIQRLRLLSGLTTEANTKFYQQYESMFNNMLTSYQQKKLGLLEFLDFFNAYTDTRQKLLQQQLSLQLAKEELNFHTGIDLVK